MATQLAQAGNHLLTELVMEIKSGNLRRCEALGLTDNEIRLLNSLTIEDLHYLSQSPVSIITCQIHRENLRLLLTRAKEVHRQNQMIERCLRLGASIDLLNQYFGMTSLEVSARRRLSGIRGNAGRSQRLSDVQQTELWYRWKEEGMPEPDDPDCLQIMVSCAEKMNVSLTTVWNSVQEWHRDGILNSADRGEISCRITGISVIINPPGYFRNVSRLFRSIFSGRQTGYCYVIFRENDFVKK
ncbi:DUF2857 domain-containing protein [Proteus mirabilis]